MKARLIGTMLGLSLIVAALCIAGCDSPKAPEHGKAKAPAAAHEAAAPAEHGAAEHEEAAPAEHGEHTEHETPAEHGEHEGHEDH